MASPIVQNGRLSLAGRDVSFVLRRMPRRRHVHLFVSERGEVEVRAPWRYSTDRAESVIREHAEWVLDALDRMRRRIAARPRLDDGAVLNLLDTELRLRVECRAQIDLFAGVARPGKSPAAVQRDGRMLRVTVPRPGQEVLRHALESWYRTQARSWCHSRIALYAQVLGVRPAGISIRGQRTRWGSCSARGTLSLNWRLMLVPSSLADYIVVHELCHLRHMDHSKRFWSLVGSVFPDYRERSRRLDELQDQLVL